MEGKWECGGGYNFSQPSVERLRCDIGEDTHLAIRSHKFCLNGCYMCANFPNNPATLPIACTEAEAKTRNVTGKGRVTAIQSESQVPIENCMATLARDRAYMGKNLENALSVNPGPSSILCQG